MRCRLPAFVLTAFILVCTGGAAAQSLTMSVPATTSVAVSGTTDIPVQLSDGAGVSGGQFTLTLSPLTGIEIVGVVPGALLTPAGSFTVTTNPQTISTSTPTSGPLTVLIDSTGASMPGGPGSIVLLTVRQKAGCAGATSLTFTNQRVTRNFASVTPQASNGQATCSAGTVPLSLSIPESVAVDLDGEDIPVNLNDGAGVSGGQFTLSLSPTSNVEIVGVAAGTLLSPAGSFTITTNPQGIGTATPTTGPVTVLVDSTGQSLAAGGGSVARLRVRCKQGAASGAVTTLALTAASFTRNFASTTPMLDGGSAVSNCGAPPDGPTVDLGDVQGRAGLNVEVPIVLVPAQACGASTLTADIAFNSTQLTAPAPCVVTVGSAALGWVADCNLVQQGVLRVTVYGQSGSMTSGTVATVRFAIPATVPPGTVIAIGNQACSVAQSSPLLDCSGEICTGGTVTVSGLAGDCDGNNSVTITEVQKVVSLLLGRTVPGGCAGADCNANGQVSAFELQCAVNNFLGIVPSCSCGP